MGRGNYCPKNRVSDQWYIDYDLYRLTDEDDDWTETDYDLLAEDLAGALKAIAKRFPSFRETDRRGDTYWCESIRLENRLFRVGTADNEWSEALFIEMRDDLCPEDVNLARRHLQSYRDGIEKILLEWFGEVARRNGPWMSSRITAAGSAS